MSEWVLRGREHHELAQIALHADGDAAIALSIGGAPKRYAHTDPNEDVALLVAGDDGLLLAVADGHGGYEAAEIAIEAIRSWAAGLPASTEGTWRGRVLGALAAANHDIRSSARGGGRRLSRTTLALARVEPAANAIRWASIGDSHIFHAAGGALDVAHAGGHGHPREGSTFFLGFADESGTGLADKCRIGEERLAGTEALVLATDGLSERGVGVDEPEDTVAAAVASAAECSRAERAAALARGVVDAAIAAHRSRRSGDNVAVAAAWLAELTDR